jgi:hypothetical protein
MDGGQRLALLFAEAQCAEQSRRDKANECLLRIFFGEEGGAEATRRDDARRNAARRERVERLLHVFFVRTNPTLVRFFHLATLPMWHNALREDLEAWRGRLEPDVFVSLLRVVAAIRLDRGWPLEEATDADWEAWIEAGCGANGWVGA